MKCIVFGGAGFLGEHLCKGLVEKGYQVTVYDRQSDKLEKLKLKYPSIEYIAGDFVHDETFDQVLEGVKCVFHLISTTVPSNTDVLWDLQSNVIPTIRLLESCARANVGKIIYFSSGGTVYGIPKLVPIPENHENRPICSYGMQKLIIEEYLHFYKYNHGLKYNIMRFANPYGEGQNPFAKQGVIAVFLAKALMNQSIQIWGDSSNIRDFIYIDDVIKATLATLDYQGTETTFNIGCGIGYSVEDIIAEIKKVVKNKIAVEYLPGRKQDVATNLLDISKAQSELHWTPNVTLDIGIKKMCNSWDKEEKCFSIR